MDRPQDKQNAAGKGDVTVTLVSEYERDSFDQCLSPLAP